MDSYNAVSDIRIQRDIPSNQKSYSTVASPWGGVQRTLSPSVPSISASIEAIRELMFPSRGSLKVESDIVMNDYRELMGNQEMGKTRDEVSDGCLTIFSIDR